MREYKYPSTIFDKRWVWFAPPSTIDSEKGDLLNCFSYIDEDAPGFKKKEGLTTVIWTQESLEEVWNKMRKKFVRKQIKKGERNGIEISRSCNITAFKGMYEEFRNEKGITKEPFEVFEENGTFFCAYYKEELIAGAIFIADDQYARAWAMASKRLSVDSGSMREIIGQANRMLVWEAIKWAHEEKLDWIDLGGINPDSSDSKERSLARYKEAFGGERMPCYYYSRFNSPLLKFLDGLKKKIQQ